MRLFRSKTRHASDGHEVKILRFDDDAEAAFVAICSCGTTSPPYTTKKKAVRWGYNHSSSVTDEVEVVTDEGGVGWLCLFCGSAIGEAPLRISVRWTDDGVDEEQWYAAHRECLVQRMSQDEWFAPRFGR